MHRFLLPIILLLLVACGSEPTAVAGGEETADLDTAFISSAILIEPNSFPSYTDPSISSVIQDARLCTLDSNDMELILCNSDLFRVWPLGDSIPYEQGFICESRSLMFNGGVSKNVVVYTQESGKWKRVNHLIGKLIELTTTASGFYDLVLTYKDSELGNINVRHAYNGTYFDRVEVIEINDYKVVESSKDSLFNVYLKEFRWGY